MILDLETFGDLVVAVGAAQTKMLEAAKHAKQITTDVNDHGATNVSTWNEMVTLMGEVMDQINEAEALLKATLDANKEEDEGE